MNAVPVCFYLFIFEVEENNNVDAKPVQQKRKRPRVVFVTGSSGSGKTTLCQNLKRENGFVHFDVDMWVIKCLRLYFLYLETNGGNMNRIKLSNYF